MFTQEARLRQSVLGPSSSARQASGPGALQGRPPRPAPKSPSEDPRPQARLFQSEIGPDAALLQDVDAEELQRLQTALASDHALNLYLQVLAQRQKLTPRKPRLQPGQLAEALELQFAYLKGFAAARQLRILRESKDCGKVYFLLRVFTSDKPRAQGLPAEDLAAAFAELLFALESRALGSAAATAAVLRWHLLASQLLLFGSLFVFPRAKYAHKAVYWLSNLVEAAVRAPAVPPELHPPLMHNCLNTLLECVASSSGPDYPRAMKERILQAVEARGGWARVEPGIKKLADFLSERSA